MARRSIRKSRTLAVTIAVTALTAAIGFGFINASYSGHPLAADAGWMAAVNPVQSTPWLAPSLFLHEVGAGLPAFVIVSVITGILFLWNRPWGAVCFGAAAIASTAVVELMKNTIGRPRPADALIDVGFGSYPSGHSARAAVISVTVGILLPRWWAWMLGAFYTLAMMFSRTQLGAHWLTDTIGGALTGAAVALLCFAAVAGPLAAEGARGHPPPWESKG